MNEAKLLLASWGRSLAASIACYLAGVTDWIGSIRSRCGGRASRDFAILKSCGFSFRAH
jgi:hypothetical protein